MSYLIYWYKKNLHFSVNFYAVFLLITFIPDILGFDAALVRYPFWALKAFLAFLIIREYPNKFYALSWLEKLFLAVVMIYFINLCFDVFLQRDPHGYGSPIDVFSFVLSILIAFSFRYDPLLLSSRSFYSFIGLLGLGLIVAFFLAKENAMEALAGRYNANSTVNMINYGQMGCALSLTAMYGFINKKFKWSWLVYPGLFALGILSIIKAGTRSPVVVLVLVAGFYFLARSGFMKTILIVSIAAIILYLLSGYIIELSLSLGSNLSERIISAVENQETSGRDMIYLNTVQIIQDSPFFGDFYLIPHGLGKGGYPHNFFLEAFLTTGFLGGIPFLIMVIISVYRSFMIIKNRPEAGWICILYLQMLVYGMFSSSLYSSQDFWALCLLVLSVTEIRAEIFKTPYNYNNEPYPLNHDVESTNKQELLMH